MCQEASIMIQRALKLLAKVRICHIRNHCRQLLLVSIIAHMKGSTNKVLERRFDILYEHHVFRAPPEVLSHTWPELSSHILALAPGGPLRLSGQQEIVYNGETTP